jgi:DNA-binding LytR/AlgR family response regulator
MMIVMAARLKAHRAQADQALARGSTEIDCMLAIGLCDDEEPDLENLRAMIERYARLKHLPCDIRGFSSGEDLLFVVDKGGTFDIVFLDVFMGLANGVDIAREIRAHDQSCSIIFATNSRGHAIDGYGVRALQYLLKPLAEHGVFTALDQAIAKMSQEAECFILLVNKQGSYRILFNDIVFVESNARVITIHTSGQGDLSFYVRLDDFERQCGDPRFMRCHKSYLVNLDYVFAIENHCMRLETGQRIRISIGLSNARSAFASYTARKI